MTGEPKIPVESGGTSSGTVSENKQALRDSIEELADILRLYVIDTKIYHNREVFMSEIARLVRETGSSIIGGRTLANRAILEAISAFYLSRMKEKVSQINDTHKNHHEIKINQKICKLRGDREEDLEDWIFQRESCLEERKTLRR